MPQLSDDEQGNVLAAPLLRVSGIHKTFGATHAVRGAALAVYPGTVHALVGENGAGKSSLGRVLAGAIVPDAGQMELDGLDVAPFGTPSAALRRGVAMIAQEIALAPDLTVGQNIFMGADSARAGLLRPKHDLKRAEVMIREAGFTLNPRARVADLTLAEQQEVALLWALARDARLIVMDEPTAALARLEAGKLLESVRRLRARGLAIVYVSHFLDEVLEIADTITVMRGGVTVSTVAAASTNPHDLVVRMLGREQDAAYPDRPPRRPTSKPLLTAQPVSSSGERRGLPLAVSAGEIIGLFGLVGSGRSELVHAVVGASNPATAEVRVDGANVRFRRPKDSIETGVTLLPESRRDQGLFLNRCLTENSTAATLGRWSSGGILRQRTERPVARKAAQRMGINPPDVKRLVGTLSGGNQQKVMFARCLIAEPRVVILDEPTRGIDIGAKRSIYDTLVALTEKMLAVVMISSDLDELMHICHRIYVMRQEEIVAHFDGDFEQAPILRAAFGHAQQVGETAGTRHD
jgi:ABC-type sugar transport system ATPase subunit